MMQQHHARIYKRTTLTFLGLILLFGLIKPTLAQSPLSARVDRNTLALNEQVTLVIRVSDSPTNISNPDLSDLQDFVVISFSISDEVSIVNGQMSSQKVFIYRLQPLNEGLLTIESIPVIVGSNIYQTDPIRIEVLPSGTQITPPPNTPSANDDDTTAESDFFVEAEVSNIAPYLGEQIIYTFRIYQAVQFPPGQLDYRPPAFTDF